MKDNFFCYLVNTSGNLAPSASLPVDLQFDSDSDFLLQEIKAGGATGMTISIKDASDNVLSNNPLLTSIVSGSLGVKYISNPVRVSKGSKWTLTFTNTDSTQHSEEVQFWGKKV